ncbi:sugar phosphate isomerase/epimerase family protein [Rubritepida flocculans]|uniref:sugar phosphate isomerase/epimerase family protein n=1 Tax=Rubritepida flocculans TaxID=182403 RepID=UPI00041927BF|nr:sugar phosphate isomerase/epimerase [Rubritepida flocculans]
MRIALCNEVVRELPFPRQAALAAALGYDGLELAPFTLDAEAPQLLPAARRAEARRIAGEEGAPILGLHWLLVAPAGLSITRADRHAETLEVMRRLIGLAADLGARYLVHGSPAQRRLEAPGDAGRAEAALAAAAEEAGRAGLTYILEPLDPGQTNWAASLAEALEIVRRIGHPALATMLDVSAAGRGEAETVPALLRRHLPSGLIAHIHLNDRNRRAPGQGEDRFAPILAALRQGGYAGDAAVEPFDYLPDGPACAARAIGYLRGIREALDA